MYIYWTFWFLGLFCLAISSRLLYAISEDIDLPCFRIIKKNLKKITIVTGFICFGAIMIGNIDMIAPIITMLFLFCYGVMNLCCLLLDKVSFRTTLKFYHKMFSFTGLGLCIFLMVAISWLSFVIVISLVFVLILKTGSLPMIKNDNDK